MPTAGDGELGSYSSQCPMVLKSRPGASLARPGSRKSWITRASRRGTLSGFDGHHHGIGFVVCGQRAHCNSHRHDPRHIRECLRCMANARAGASTSPPFPGFHASCHFTFNVHQHLGRFFQSHHRAACECGDILLGKRCLDSNPSRSDEGRASLPARRERK